MLQIRIGELTVDRIVESICTDFVPLRFFPSTTADDWSRHRQWMLQAPQALDPVSGNLVLTIQGFLVRSRHHTILVDTCVGDHKERTHHPFWDRMRLDTFLPRLAAAGVTPAQVTHVLCTHMHTDHVGWNTRLDNGRWVPTFPNARYLFARTEWEHWQAVHRTNPLAHLLDSVLPIVEAKQAEFVAMDHVLDEHVRFEPTPGHTMGHVSVHLASQGQHAVITGDCIHSPVQCLEPQWIMRADTDPALACRSRRDLLERYAEQQAIVCATHFPEPSFGRVSRRGEAFQFQYVA